MGAWVWQARVACCFSSEGGIGLRDGTFRLASRSGEAPELSSPKYQTITLHQFAHPDMLVWKWVQKEHLGVAEWAHEGCLRLTRHLGRQNPGPEWRCIFGSHQATAHPRATASSQPCQSLTAKDLPGHSTESFFEENYCDQIR